MKHLFLLTTVFFCLPCAYAQTGTRHPAPEALLPDSLVDHVITQADTLSSSPSLNMLAKRLRLVEPLFSVDFEYKPLSEHRQRFADIVVDSTGAFIVADWRQRMLVRFDSTGAATSSFGGLQQRPLAFQEMGPLVLISNQTLYASDTRHTMVLAVSDTAFAQTGHINVQWPDDGCALGDSAVFFESARSQPIRLLNPAGEVSGTFGYRYPVGPSLVRHGLTASYIACSAASELIFQAPRYVPILRGYYPDGTLRWQSRLGSFTYGRIEEAKHKGQQGSLFYGMDNGYWEMVIGLTTVHKSYFLLQTERRYQSPESGPIQVEIHSYLFDATGAGVYLSDSLPVIHASAGDRLLAAIEGPEPRVTVFKMAPLSASN